MKTKLQKLIAKGKTEEAINLLLELSNNDANVYNIDKDMVIMQSAKHNEYQDRKRKGISTVSEQSISLSRINDNLLAIIKKMSDDLPENEAENEEKKANGAVKEKSSKPLPSSHSSSHETSKPPQNKSVEKLKIENSKNINSGNVKTNGGNVHIGDNITHNTHNRDKEPKEPKNSDKPTKWLGIAALVMTVLGGIAAFTGLSLKDYWTNTPDTNNPLQLTAFVRDANNNIPPIKDGQLTMTIGHRSTPRQIGNEGRLNFGEFYPDQLKDSLEFVLQAEGYELVNPKKKYLFEGDQIKVLVKQDDSLGEIKGIVKSRDGNNFIEGVQVLINTDTTITTNKNGVFKIVLPPKMRVKNKTQPYRLTFTKDNQSIDKEYYPLSGDLEVRFEQ